MIDVKKLRYKDNLTKKRQRRFLVTAVALAVGAVALVIAIGYALFFSHWFDIKNVSIDGLADARAVTVHDVIQKQLDLRWLGLPIGDNIIFFPSSRIQTLLSASFPFIQTVSIKKKFFHGLVIDATERQSEGIWCFTTGCSYFDVGGVLIGPAPRSSGFLTLTINDQRAGQQSIDPKFLIAAQTIRAGLDSQGIKIKDVTIPADTFTEFDVATGGGYPIKFSIDSDLAAQLHALGIFRSQHPDPDPPYQYLDLRFDGRVYYK